MSCVNVIFLEIKLYLAPCNTKNDMMLLLDGVIASINCNVCTDKGQGCNWCGLQPPWKVWRKFDSTSHDCVFWITCHIHTLLGSNSLCDCGHMDLCCQLTQQGGINLLHTLKEREKKGAVMWIVATCSNSKLLGFFLGFFGCIEANLSSCERHTLNDFQECLHSTAILTSPGIMQRMWRHCH